MKLDNKQAAVGGGSRLASYLDSGFVSNRPKVDEDEDVRESVYLVDNEWGITELSVGANELQC